MHKDGIALRRMAAWSCYCPYEYRKEPTESIPWKEILDKTVEPKASYLNSSNISLLPIAILPMIQFYYLSH